MLQLSDKVIKQKKKCFSKPFKSSFGATLVQNRKDNNKLITYLVKFYRRQAHNQDSMLGGANEAKEDQTKKYFLLSGPFI